MKRLPYCLGATGLALALGTVSCTTLGTHVKSGFACKAPQGTCAPMSNIDAQAIAGLGASDAKAMPIGSDGDRSRTGMIMASFDGEPARSGERTMKVVFPAHSDSSGVFHEEAIAHVVSEWSRWVMRAPEVTEPGSLDAAITKGAASAQPAGVPVASVAPDNALSPLPTNLAEAAAGLSAPADPMPQAPADQVAVSMPGSDAGLPTAAALAAAHAGHRIGDPQAAVPPAVRHGRSLPRKTAQISRAQPTVPGAATAMLNRAQLQQILARSAPTVPRSHQTADAEPKVRQVASAAVDSHGGRP